MTPIFTRRFFALPARYQAAVVAAELRDIEGNFGRYITAEDEQRARQQAVRIRRKAVRYGVLKD
jgi:hypothetical protein